jgi:hippurate hydrolase
MSDLHAALLAQAETLLPHAVQLRREIHRHPELGNQLPKTRASVLQALQPLDLDVRLSQSTSGIVAVLEGSAAGPSILLRGDMDALPMPEDTGLEFASEIDGRMHACGHDSHTAMLAMAAHLLSARRAELPGKVIFMFQPGEEGPGGAQPMIDEGLFDADARPDAAFALHIYPNLRSGMIACRAGAFLAAADKVTIEIRGRGGHGSMPYDANDPVPVICELVQAFQTFVTRRFKPFDPVVLTVGRIAAGTVNNVIPERAMLEATLRSFSTTARETAQTGIRRLAEQLAAAYEMQAEVIIDEGYPATYNDAEFVKFVRQTTRELFGEDAYLEMPEPLMGAEDFSLMLQRMPGAMAFLGVAPDDVDPATAAPCHSNRMQLNESAMAHGVALHAAVACEFLRKHG